MPLVPAVKFMDTVIGVDIHALAPIPGIPVHPYVGPVFLWATPVFPSMNVFINGMPACTIGALGYFPHIPQGVPLPPTPANQGYWKRYLVNIPMVLALTGLTMLANVAIAGIAALIPKSKSAEKFIKDVTGVDTTDRASTWQSIQGMFASYSKWQTWAQLLMPPLPYPGAQGSVAVGSPSVTVNGAALAFVGPLLGTSCSDIPIVPNAVTLGFSNVLVGVSFADMLRGIAVAAAQRAVQHAAQQAGGSGHEEEEAPPEEEPTEEQNPDCRDGGHPVSQATGAAWSRFIDINAPYIRLRRTFRSTWCDVDGPFGFSMRHDRQYALSIEKNRAVLTNPNNRTFVFPQRDGTFSGVAFGWRLSEREDGWVMLGSKGVGTLYFRNPSDGTLPRLFGILRGTRRERFIYDAQGRLAEISVEDSDDQKRSGKLALAYDGAGHVTTIIGTETGASAITLGCYTYDSQGCLADFADALGGRWSYAYDEAHRCVRETNPNGYSFHYKYDGEGRCIASAGDDGLWRVNLRYAPGRTLMTEADNGLWVYSIDERRTIVEILDPYGGKLQRKPAANGQVLLEVDSGGRLMRNLFDENGGEIGRLDRWGNRWPTPEDAPKLPNPLAHHIPLTAMTREWGDARSPPGTVGRALTPSLLAAIDAVLPASPRAPVEERHDLLGRVIERTDADGAVEHYDYDPAGNRIQVTDADGVLHRHEFGSWNLRLAATDPNGAVTRYRYTRREKIAAIIDANGGESKYTYDCKDRLTHVVRHGVLREQYRYDLGDRLIEKLDGAGNAILKMQIGADGVQSERVLASGEKHSFTYSPHGEITEASTSRARVLIGYERRRRLSDVRNGRGVVHEWAGERLATSTYFDRFTIRYEDLGPGDTLIHLPVGPPQRVTVDEDGTTLRALGGGTRELSRYDAAGRCTGRARWRDGERAPARWVSYRYSHGGELRDQLDDRGRATVYSYDSAHRLIARNGAAGPCVYAYDPAGNLTSTHEHPALTYAEGNRLARIGAEAVRYDTRNHLAEIDRADGRCTRFFYDSLDLLVRVEEADGCKIWQAEYDGLCRRTAKIVDDARTEYFWDGDRMAAEETPDGRLRIYIYPDIVALTPLGFVDYAMASAAALDGRLYAVFHDQIGLPLLIEDASGQVAWRAARTEPYGVISIASSSRLIYNMRFPGHYFDIETGLHQCRFRSYSPVLGRFLQSDPAGQSGGINLYAYISSPLVLLDLLGLNHKADTSATESADQSGRVETPGEPNQPEVPPTQAEGQAPAAESDPPFTDAPGNQPPFSGEPGSTVRAGMKSRTYGPDGWPQTDRCPPHPDEAGTGNQDHCHDWGRPADGGKPTNVDRGNSRDPQPGDPPVPRGPNVPPP